MNLGEKLRKLREERGLSQKKLAEKLGYVSNSYVLDVEQGKYIPSEGKLKKIAKALGVPLKELKDLALGKRIEDLGIKEKELKELFLDVPHLPKEDKKKIIEAYLKIKEKRRKK